MSHNQPGRSSDAHHQKIDEILSIYIQSEMIGRKNNNLNLKISSTTRPPGTAGSGTSSGSHFSSSKPPRSVPVKLKSGPSAPVPSKPTTPPSQGQSSGRRFSKSPRRTNAASAATEKSFRYTHSHNSFDGKLSRSSTIIISPKKLHGISGNVNNIPTIRDKSGHNPCTGSGGSGTGTGNGMKDKDNKDVKVTFCSEKMRDFQVENSVNSNANFQFHQIHQEPTNSTGGGGCTTNFNFGPTGGGSSVSENDPNDDENLAMILNSVRSMSMTSPPSSRRGSPRQSPMSVPLPGRPFSPSLVATSPTFNHGFQYSHSTPCSPKHGENSTESYARILATLKRIEDEERYNYDYNFKAAGDQNQNQNPPSNEGSNHSRNNSLEKYPNLPPGDHHKDQNQDQDGQLQLVPSRPNSSPMQSNNQFNFNRSPSGSPSPRKLNSRFTASSSSCMNSPPPRLPPSQSQSSSPRLPPLTPNLENNSNNISHNNIPGSNGHNSNNGSGNGNGNGNSGGCPSNNTTNSIANSNSHSHSHSHSGNSGGSDRGSGSGSGSDVNRQVGIGIGVEEHFTYEIHSARSIGSQLLGDEPIRLSSCCNDVTFRPGHLPYQSPRWGEVTSDEKAKNIFSFLDEVEKSDRETLFNLKLDKPNRSKDGHGFEGNATDGFRSNFSTRSEFPNHTMDSLIRKGSVELAREIILLERKIEETQHNVTVLEETLINQRELNLRHIKNSERDLKKRLKLQQEEFELALTRHQAFVDQLIAEKRSLQDKCEKILRDLKDTEMKYQDQIKSLQSKHLEELKRLRRVQENSEKNRRMKWMGNKTQEIRETTIKGLEPELQRVIQRHQQEMTEMRAWHANELHEMEERCSRKLLKQSQDIREQMLLEKDENLRRDRELMARRHESETEQLTQEIESQKRRHLQELHEERERFEVEQQKVKDLIQESIKKVEIKAEVELETLKEEYEAKFLAQERRHETELKTISNVHDAERESYVANYNKKLEQTIAEKELILAQGLKVEKEAEIEERERKLRSDFDKQWKEQEDLYESRLRRLQDKFQVELKDFEEAEKELKAKFTQVKAELISKEEEIFTLKTTVNLKEKQNTELADNNMKMLEERASLTAVIRREFMSQIEDLEKDCMAVKSSVIDLKAKQKLDQEQHLIELEKVRNEKDFELDKVGQRVVQAMARKEDTILELQKQLEKASFRVGHLEELLEQQRKEFVKSMTSTTTLSTNKNHQSGHHKHK